MVTTNKKRIIQAIITIGLVIFLLSYIEVEKIAETISTIPPVLFLLCFILYIFSYFLRAFRFRILLNETIGFKDLFSIVSVHNMLNNILPARSGELSYIYLVKRTNDISIDRGIATLMIARIFDFIAISLLVIISAIVVKDLPVIISNALIIVLILLMFVIILLISLILYRESGIALIEKIATKLNLNKIRIINSLITKGEETIKNFGILKSKKISLFVFLHSLVIWLFLYLISYILYNEMGIELSFWEIIFCSTLALFTFILPIQSIGGFGTQEGAYAIAFIAVGIPKELAITSAFSLHIISYIYFLILGGYGLLYMRLMKDK